MSALEMNALYGSITRDVMELRVRNAEHKAPLKASEIATAEAFVRKYHKNIIAKWVNFFVMHKSVKSTIIRTKL